MSRRTIQSSSFPFDWSIVEIILYSLVGLLVVLLSLSKLSGDDDFFWHLAIGRWIVEHHRIPSHDPFSAGVPNQPWSPLEWLWDVCTYLLYSWTGSYYVLQFLPLCAALLIFTLVILLLKRLHLSPVIITVVWIIALGIISDRLTPRPHLMTLVGLAIVVFVYFLFRYVQSEKIFFLYYLPPLFLLWANTHPGVVSGLILLGSILTAETMMAMRKKNFAVIGAAIQPLDRRRLTNVAVVAVVSFVCTLANPRGVMLYADIYSHTQLKLLSVIKEWIPPFDISDSSGILILYKVFVVLGLLTLWYSWKRKDFLQAFLLVVFVAYSLRAVRFVGDFAVVAATGISLGMQHLFTSVIPVLHNITVSRGITLVLLVVILFFAWSIANGTFYSTIFHYPKEFGLGFDSSYFPLKMIDFLRTNKITGKVFNDLDVGGLLLWYFPSQKNFIDSRNLSDELGKTYYGILTKQSGFEDKLKKFDFIIFRLVDIITNPVGMHQSLISYCSTHREEWKLVYWDDLAFVYVKNIPQYREVIERFEYKILHPYLLAFQTPIVDSLRRQFPAQYRQELERKRNEDPTGVITSIFLRYDQTITPKRLSP
jgi:hypothetical protein